ncbi:MAG: hypothetical protein ACRDS9_04150 [Pseudonocardiaceae bacterium]
MVGSNPPGWHVAAGRYEPRVTVTGWVPDVTPWLDAAQVVVCPLTVGAGSKSRSWKRSRAAARWSPPRSPSKVCCISRRAPPWSAPTGLPSPPPVSGFWPHRGNGSGNAPVQLKPPSTCPPGTLRLTHWPTPGARWPLSPRPAPSERDHRPASRPLFPGCCTSSCRSERAPSAVPTCTCWTSRLRSSGRAPTVLWF